MVVNCEFLPGSSQSTVATDESENLFHHNIKPVACKKRGARSFYDNIDSNASVRKFQNTALVQVSTDSCPDLRICLAQDVETQNFASQRSKCGNAERKLAVSSRHPDGV